MPIATIDSLKQKTVRLKKKLADAGESLAGPAARALEKKIRRAQRSRRKLEAGKARAAGKTEEKKG